MLKKMDFYSFYCQSLQQLKWSSWWAVPEPFIKKDTDTFSSFIKAVDELLHPTLGYECMEHDVMIRDKSL